MSLYDLEETTTEIHTKYTFVWFANGDACRKCSSLSGQVFEGQDIFQSRLWSPIWGDVFDIDNGQSLTHLHCRCTVEVNVETTPIDVSTVDEYTTFLEILK